ncbi:S-layer homology domain-containing protein [Paenibacillus sp. DYY-L-2]|uniref:Ig-like domain-containing protein n=1 Tax=Paenibacillus sp. DYY-L-2 TaxID=3447013 RepID=UPI003F4FC0E1
MSNTSYSFKENSHVIVNQGGEKKVMKKILSVALSTAMAFSMFASVAFGADAKLTDQQQFDALKQAGIVNGFPDGQAHLEKALTRAELAKIIVLSLNLTPVDATSYKDKNYANHWGRTYIEAATQAGILNGKDATKKLFDPNGNVTVQELAKVLVTALKLEVPTDANNTASEWAKGYVAAAVKAGFLQEGINYQANATRSQAVVAAYAIYEAAQFKVTKAEAIDATHVKLTLSTGEVVDVTLEKALEPNKATELEYTTKDGKVLKYTVTYVLTAATKVDSVSADNLKQITVKFDGEVDKKSAETVSNYKITREIDSAVLSADKRSVVLTLKGENYTDGNKLENQRETKLTVDGVKSSDLARTLKQEVKFTPVDVTTPAIKEVVGLGTKAIKVVFSEPVDRASAISTSNYKIDGKPVAGYIDYAFPNSVILSTELATGDHKLTVSNVQDFSGLKVVPVDNDFTVAVDTEAPTVVKATADDLFEVEVEFNEPLKSVSKAYNGISSKTGTVSFDRASNKIKVKFSKANALSVTENTIVIEGATDYSGNSATREVKVTPTLDTTRPEVTEINVDTQTDGDHIIKVKFSEAVNSDDNTTGKNKSNYTIKDKDGKVVVGKGLDGSGHPVKAIVFNSDNNEATIELSGTLDKGTYTLEVSGIQDNAYVPNTILPVSKSFEVGDTSEFKVSRFWAEVQPTTNSNNKRDIYFYVTFTKPVATSGTGDATVAAKYNVAWQGANAAGTNYEALPADSYVELVTPETVKVIVPYTDKVVDKNAVDLRVSLVADQDGKFAYETAGFVGYAFAEDYTNDIAVATGNATAIAKDKVKVKFDGKLTNVDASEFEVFSNSVSATDATYDLTLDNYVYEGGNTIATFTIKAGEKLAPNATDAVFRTKSAKLVNGKTVNTQDTFGVKVAFAPVTLKEEIKPEAVKINGEELDVVTTGTNQYQAIVEFNEDIKVVPGTNVVKLSATGSNLEISNVTYERNQNNHKQLLVNFTTNKALQPESVITVEILAANADSKVVTDVNDNAAAAVTRSAVYQNID